MKKYLSLMLGVCMMFSAVTSAAFAGTAASDLVAVSMGFESVMTNSSPSGISVSNAYAYVRQPDKASADKKLEIAKTAKAASVGFALGETSDSMNFSFDFMMEDTLTARLIGVRDTASVVGSILKIDTQGVLTTTDNKKITELETKQWYNISFICRFGDNRADLYVNGKCVASKILLGNASKFDKVNALWFSMDARGFGSTFYLDNVRCCKGSKFLDSSAFPAEEFNSGVDTYVSGVDEAYQDSESVYINTDFNSDAPGNKPAIGSGEVKDDANFFMVREVPDSENKSFVFSKNGTGDPLYNFSISDFKALYAILEVTFMSTDTASDKVITMRDVNAQFNEVVRIAAGGDIRVAGTSVGTYKTGQWYDLAIVMSYRDFTIDAYINGEAVKEDIPFKNVKADSPSTLRLTIPSASAGGTIYIDNLRFYAGKEFKGAEQLSGSDNTAGKQLTAPESEVEAMLADCVAMQSNGTKAYAGGKKTQITQGAAIKNKIAYVPARYIAEQLGAQVAWHSDTRSAAVKIGTDEAVYTVGSDKASLNGNPRPLQASPYMENGVTMIPADDFLSSFLDVQITFDDKYGIVVLDSAKKSVTPQQLKDVYDYITYTRPDAEKILSDFKAKGNVHPRIIASAGTFERIAASIKINDTIKNWYLSIVQKADETITQKHTYYYIPDGTRLLDMSRQLLSRSYNLSLVYRMTEDQKYLNYLWDEIKAVCEFEDWNSEKHFLDTAEMMTGVSIAYDWLYDVWTDEQRSVMEEAILNMGLKEGKRFYDFAMPSGTQWQTINNNWGVVCNGGMTVGALALIDKHPEYCAGIISTAFLSLENALGEFSPDGAWVEGPDYWSYTNQYLGYYMSSLINSLGTEYGYLSSNNIVKTGEYATYTQSHQGAFNVGDAGAGKVGNASVFFYADFFDKPELAKMRLLDIENYKFSPTTMDIIYLDPQMLESEVDLSLDYMMRDVEMATFRSAWGDSTALFAGIKGGYNDVTHGNLDCGTFVIDAMGVRWADELGSDNYNQSNYFTKTNAARYYLYFCSTQGQNVLALNPLSDLGQEQFATAKIVDFVSKPRGGYTVIDMTSAYGSKVTSARRGMKADHNRTQVVIQDELSLKNATDVWWFMQTKASVEIIKNGRAALLSKNRRTMYVGLDTNVKGARFTVSSSSQLEGSPIKPGVNSTAAFRRLQINLQGAKGDVRLAVRFVPITGDMLYEDIMNNGIEKLTPIDMWNIEDGEISYPKLSSISINGAPLEEFSPERTAYNIDLEFGNDAAPVISADVTDNYIAEISQPDSANGTGEIKVYEKGNESAAVYYSLSFKVQPLMGQPEGYDKLDIKSVQVSSEPQEENPKSHAIDGDINTRWSGEGDSEWIRVDLGKEHDISTITLSFYQGTKRVTYFDIQVSLDGTNYTTVFSGESSGLTDGYESYFIGSRKARYIRFNSRGNSSNKWNSFNEIEIYGK